MDEKTGKINLIGMLAIFPTWLLVVWGKKCSKYHHNAKCKFYVLGMSILPSGNFNSDEIMPICLPSSKNYEDSKRGTLPLHCYVRGASKK